MQTLSCPPQKVYFEMQTLSCPPQKVYFEMQSDTDSVKYTSTVRSCAEDCVTQDDFLDCDVITYSTRGCVRRDCCRDDDLCNTGAQITYCYFFTIFMTIGVTIL